MKHKHPKKILKKIQLTHLFEIPNLKWRVFTLLLSLSVLKPVKVSQLDRSFGAAGVVTTDIASIGISHQSTEKINALVVDNTNGKLIAVGSSLAFSPTLSRYVASFSLVQYKLLDGRVDTSFGNGGKVTTLFGKESRALTAEKCAGRKILVAGYAVNMNGEYQVQLAKYQWDGVMDKSFGTNGSVVTNFAPQGMPEGARLLLSHSNSKILMAGYAYMDSDYPRKGSLIIARYKRRGSLDPSFGDGGRAVFDLGPEANLSFVPDSLSLKAGRKILVAGRVVEEEKNGGKKAVGFALFRLLATGKADLSFGDRGLVRVLYHDSFIEKPFITPDGKIVVAGRARLVPEQGTDFILHRFHSDGTFDRSFGKNGMVSVNVGLGLLEDSDDYPHAVAVQEDGRILVAGESLYHDDAFRTDYVLIRLNEDGSIDSGFGEDGRVTTPIGLAARAEVISVQKDGRIITAGSAEIGGSTGWDYAMVRYSP